MSRSLINDNSVPLVETAAPLQHRNTLAVPAVAEHLARVQSVGELRAALQWWQLHGGEAPVMALGGGSNLVLAGNVGGLVLQIEIPGREVLREDEEHVWLKVGAGENWHDLVEYCVNCQYWGLENLALIPGSVGAAPIQNIGAYGVELCDVFSELTALEVSSGKQVMFGREACEFGYRDSVFKRALRDQFIITSVTFRLNKKPATKAAYPALKAYFAEHKVDRPTSQQVFEAVVAVRRSKLPDPGDIPNAGSFFKNPLVSLEQFNQLQRRYPDLVGYPAEANRVKLAAGWLIDRAGWRGYRHGPVGVHNHQALVIINPGCGTGDEVLALARSIQADVQKKYGVVLEIEPRVYGA
ncbi:UDP-N-acetylmuramate dehydrogenase [Aestuariicella hydrocarbonica]|uniref:UDP-N-acetylenolpyruvoylglucosamine reductase n=1 Tax=Pseudomaricurvus hydrocarbonicus TaxID=1470433 RepID=A0A9E5MGW6_9GAMM|nr:UDP-N-acetylmuramate dehydrogenase [Aestuariicella hydrocarbonica]NHO65226.1 UDP-N-acetylmuramate dehydrogenase [Aestuariicella hydrocarbonica]